MDVIFAVYASDEMRGSGRRYRARRAGQVAASTYRWKDLARDLCRTLADVG